MHFAGKWFARRAVVHDCGPRRNVRIGGKAIHEITRLTVQHAREFFKPLKKEIATDDLAIYKPLEAEIVAPGIFRSIGFELSDARSAGRYAQRRRTAAVRLATGIGSGLVGVCYVLDEPSIGLHPRDNDRLIAAFRELQAQGNTVLVVEHDAAMMLEADHLIDMGPGAATWR